MARESYEELKELYDSVWDDIRYKLRDLFVPYGDELIDPYEEEETAEVILNCLYVAEPREEGDSRKKMARRLFKEVKKTMKEDEYRIFSDRDYHWAYCFIDYHFTDEEGF